MFLSALAGDVYAYLHTHASAFTNAFILYFTLRHVVEQPPGFYILLSAPLIKKKQNQVTCMWFSLVMCLSDLFAPMLSFPIGRLDL